MSFYTTKDVSSIPENAVQLTKGEALKLQKALIRDWNNNSDVFFIRYGKHLAAACVFLSSCLISKHFVKYLRINSPQVYAPYALITIPPTAVIFNKFEKMVTNNILIMKMNCPMCTQMRYLVTQLSSGYAYPFLSSVLLLQSLAHKLETFDVPNIHNNFNKFVQLTFKIVKDQPLRYQVIGGVQIILVFLIPYLQGNELANIYSILERQNGKW